MATEFCMATKTSLAHTSHIKPAQVVVIMKLPEEQTLMDTSVESCYLVHTDHN